MAAHTATAGPWSTARPSPHTPAAVAPIVVRAPHAVITCRAAASTSPLRAGTPAATKTHRRSGACTVERCQRLGQRDLRGALEVRSDREAVAEAAGPAGCRRVRRGRVGQGGNRHARHQACRRFTGHAHPPRLARDPASGRCRRSHGVHTRQRGRETARHPPCRPRSSARRRCRRSGAERYGSGAVSGGRSRHAAAGASRRRPSGRGRRPDYRAAVGRGPGRHRTRWSRTGTRSRRAWRVCRHPARRPR